MVKSKNILDLDEKQCLQNSPGGPLKIRGALLNSVTVRCMLGNVLPTEKMNEPVSCAN